MEQRYLKRPNLPQRPVSHMLIGVQYADKFIPKFKKFNIEVLPIPDNPGVAAPVSSHVDLSVCHLGGDSLIVSENIVNKLTILEDCIVSATEQTLEDSDTANAPYVSSMKNPS